MNWIKELFSTLYPEFMVLMALLFAVVLSTGKSKKLIWITSVVFLLSGFAYIVKTQVSLLEPIQLLGGVFIADKLSVLFRALILFSAVLLILGSVKYSKGFIHQSEFFIVLLSAILGAMFLVSANDMIGLFVALETMGLSAILLVGYSKYDSRSNEASIKYLLNSASASAIFLFGLSLLYGLSGSTQFYEVKYKLLQSLLTGSINIPVISIMLLFLIGGIVFKLGGAPFHMWSPDVYEGAPTPVTAFLSTVSKASALVVSIRIFYDLFDFAGYTWKPILITVSILSMLIGNFIALSQAINKSSIKRLMAYSSIAQIGYILIGVSLGTPESISASIFYMVIYAVMNLGAFLCIIAIGNEIDSDNIADYAGLVKKKPFLTFAFALCLFNLAGLPIPPAGFIAKFLLFKSGFDAGQAGIVLSSLALITTALSVYYYSYVVKLMVVDEPSSAVLSIDSVNESAGNSEELNTAIGIAITCMIILAVSSNPILNYSRSIAHDLSSIDQLISFKN